MTEGSISGVLPGKGYTGLWDTLVSALERAEKGKGRERHSNGEAFEQQLICQFERAGLSFCAGQAVKKLFEQERMCAAGNVEGAVKELLDVIVYSAARVIVLQERMQQHATNSTENVQVSHQ